MSHQKLLRDLGWIAGTLGFWGLAGCFNPDKNGIDGDTDPAETSSDDGPTDGGEAPDGEGPEGPGPGTDGESGPGEEGTDAGTTGDETGSDGTETGTNAACGDGTFEAGEFCVADEPSMMTTAPGARYIAVAALNPNLDIVTSSDSGYAISIMMGNGAGGFASPTTKAVGNNETGGGPRALALGDLDDDDDIDILALSDSNLVWFRNNGAGQFSGSGSTHPAAGSLSRGHVFIDNVDANAAGDILYSDGYGICVALGAVDPSGVYSVTAGAETSCNQRFQVCDGGGYVIPTEFGFDGDGYRDLLIGFSFSPEVAQGRGNGNGTFDLVFSECGDAGGIDVCGSENCTMSYLNGGDLDGDSEIDIVASHDQGVSVLLGNDDGTYDPPAFHATGASEESKIVDLDGDGDLDIVVASEGENGLVVLLGTGDGDFGDPIVFPAGGPVYSVAVGDANNDDAPDLFTVYGTPDQGTVMVFLSDP